MNLEINKLQLKQAMDQNLKFYLKKNSISAEYSFETAFTTTKCTYQMFQKWLSVKDFMLFV